MKLKVIILFCILNSILGATIPEADIELHYNYIVGGTNATDGQAPFQCSMQEKGRHFCGCAIISDRFLLTAAHCISEYMEINDIQILVGTNDLKSGGNYYRPEKFIKHEAFKLPPNHRYDVALIKLTDKISFSDKVQPIKITKDYIKAGTVLQAFGWGKLKTEGKVSQFLQKVNLNAITNAECYERMKNRINIHVGHLCTFLKIGEGICHGDSGGSLVMGDELVGISNWVKYPCASGGPDGFARISYLYDWIQSTMEKSA